GPETLPHQSNVALADPVDWLFCTPMASPAKLSLVAVTVAVSVAPEPTAMPVVSPVTLLSVIVTAPPAETAMPVANPVIDVAVLGEAGAGPGAGRRQAGKRGGDARVEPEDAARAAAQGQARRRPGDRGGQCRVAQLERRAGQGDGRRGAEGCGVERDRVDGEL